MIRSESTDDEILRCLTGIKSAYPVDAAQAAELAMAFAESGTILDEPFGVTADVASTGAPTSLSTLLSPLFLAAAGCNVLKLGIPGRPAGGIDALAQIPGYRTSFAKDELVNVVKERGYVHFLSAGTYAPLDARVFRLRQQHGLQDVPTLVAASLLSKKIAVGIRFAGLDVRVAPHGNFGKSWNQATANAEMFVAAAKRLGIEASPVLTDATFPYQPYIGRKEAMLALGKIFEDRADSWLLRHVEVCRTIAVACLPQEFQSSLGQLDISDLKRAFYSNLEAQGSSKGAFDHLTQTTAEAHVQTLRAQTEGFLCYNIERLRAAIVDAQEASAGSFPDPLGLRLLRHPGEWVKRGESIATIRIESTVPSRVIELLRDAVAMSSIAVGQGFETVKLHG